MLSLITCFISLNRRGAYLSRVSVAVAYRKMIKLKLLSSKPKYSVGTTWHLTVLFVLSGSELIQVNTFVCFANISTTYERTEMVLYSNIASGSQFSGEKSVCDFVF